MKTKISILLCGKKGCNKCFAAKDKLTTMGFDFDFVNLDDVDGWRRWDDGSGATDCMAEYWLRGGGELPLLKINGEWYTYPEAMKLLKSMKGEK